MPNKHRFYPFKNKPKRAAFKLKADSDFSSRVSDYTPKNKRVFASGVSFGRKYAENNRF